MKVLFVLLLLFRAVYSLPEALSEEEEKERKTKDWCFTVKDRYDIMPGQSFGKLPKNYHNQYLESKCDQYFCKKQGIGKFKCQHLE
jgi:hypothetical protein